MSIFNKISIFSYENNIIFYCFWSHVTFSTHDMIRVDFETTNDANDSIQCFDCDLCIQNWKSKDDSMIIHVQQSSNCLVEIKKEIFETSKRISKEVVAIEIKKVTITIETSKFEIFVNDINFFDFILQLNFFEFYLFNINVNFLQNLNVA